MTGSVARDALPSPSRSQPEKAAEHSEEFRSPAPHWSTRCSASESLQRSLQIGSCQATSVGVQTPQTVHCSTRLRAERQRAAIAVHFGLTQAHVGVDLRCFEWQNPWESNDNGLKCASQASVVFQPHYCGILFARENATSSTAQDSCGAADPGPWVRAQGNRARLTAYSARFRRQAFLNQAGNFYVAG
jgi:hypothetical protein